MMDVPIVVFDHPSEVELHAEGMAGAFGAAIVAAAIDPGAAGQADAGIALLEQLRDHGAVGAGPLLAWPTPRASVADDLPQGILALPWPPRAEALWTALHPNEGPGARPTVASLPGRTALLVEDHPVNQEVLRSLLDRLGVLVEIAADGQAALSALAARRYDVVLMDCHLPVLDGLSATRRHRATERQRRAPRQLILAMTASELEADRRACAEAGMDGYLVKPIRLQTLREALEGAVGAQERAAP
jgi:CheY-like chemotaxis protein